MSSDIGTDDEVRALLSSAKTIAVVGATNKDTMPVHGVMKFLMNQVNFFYFLHPQACHAFILFQHSFISVCCFLQSA